MIFLALLFSIGTGANGKKTKQLRNDVRALRAIGGSGDNVVAVGIGARIAARSGAEWGAEASKSAQVAKRLNSVS